MRAKPKIVTKVDGTKASFNSNGSYGLNYYADDDLAGCKKHFKEIARDFCYGEKVQIRIDNAKSVKEVEQIMYEMRTKDR